MHPVLRALCSVAAFSSLAAPAALHAAPTPPAEAPTTAPESAPSVPPFNDLDPIRNAVIEGDFKTAHRVVDGELGRLFAGNSAADLPRETSQIRLYFGLMLAVHQGDDAAVNRDLEYIGTLDGDDGRRAFAQIALPDLRARKKKSIKQFERDIEAHFGRLVAPTAATPGPTGP